MANVKLTRHTADEADLGKRDAKRALVSRQGGTWAGQRSLLMGWYQRNGSAQWQ